MCVGFLQVLFTGGTSKYTAASSTATCSKSKVILYKNKKEPLPLSSSLFPADLTWTWTMTATTRTTMTGTVTETHAAPQLSLKLKWTRLEQHILPLRCPAVSSSSSYHLSCPHRPPHPRSCQSNVDCL